MKKLIISALLAAPAISFGQVFDFGMVAGSIYTNPAFSTTANGSAALGTFPTSYVFTGKNFSTLFSDFSQLSSSQTTSPDWSAGQFYKASIPTSLTLNTQVWALVTTASTLQTGDWAFISGTDANWFAPSPTDPLANNIIELSLAGNQVYASSNIALFTGNVATAASNDSNLSLNTVPEPSTYALMALGGLALFFMVRRRKVQA
jgi:hypothetical protein